MDYAWYDFIGNLGVFLLLSAYLLLQLKRLSSDHLSYSLLNGLGAIFIGISLLFEFNLSAFVIEVFWLLISIMGIVGYYRSSRHPALVETEI